MQMEGEEVGERRMKEIATVIASDAPAPTCWKVSEWSQNGKQWKRVMLWGVPVRHLLLSLPCVAISFFVVVAQGLKLAFSKWGSSAICTRLK